jgi:putative transcriptional regulator
MTCSYVVLPSLLDILDIIRYVHSMGNEPPVKAKLGNRLKVTRAEFGVSQEELARLVGVTRQTISSIETGTYCPSALLAFRLAERLHENVDELFYLEEEAQ